MALVFFLPAQPANADERILSYDSRIQILPDSHLEVTETLLVRAEGTQIKRGLFRELPTVYPGRQGRRSTVGFELRSVRRDGKDEPVSPGAPSQRRDGLHRPRGCLSESR